jgi:threonine dehydratase
MTPPDPVTPAALRAAARRMAGVVRRTPLLASPALDRIAGRPVWVKAECLQVTGSFKARGAWNALACLPAALRARGVLAVSSGNHGQGVAHAAARLGVPCTVLMPADAPAVKAQGVRAWGGQVVTFDRQAEDRDARAAALAAEAGLTLIRPFDDPAVIAGQGTVGIEIAAQTRAARFAPAEVLVCCGGGGLAAGIALALDGAAGQVRTVEPAGFDDMARSLAAGRRVANPSATGSICDAILTPMPGALTFPVLAARAGPGLTVSDDEALQAMALAFTHLRIVLEPGGAVALAAALFRPGGTGPVVAVASGGNVDPALFAEALRRHA